MSCATCPYKEAEKEGGRRWSKAAQKLYCHGGKKESKKGPRDGCAVLWSVSGLIGYHHVGDLAKLVVAENGKRKIENSKEKLEHEISDCLWSLIVLANLHDVNVEKSFLKTMDDLEKYLIDQSQS